MIDLKTQFETKILEVKKLNKKPDNDTLLKLYAFYKQATIGNVTGDTPSMFDFVGRAKYNAWEKLKNTTKENAMKSYIELVEALQKTA
jgi:acyl-CoA-binding protein